MQIREMTANFFIQMIRNDRKEMAAREAVIIDLGTGSGSSACSMAEHLKERGIEAVRIVLVDRSKNALAIAVKKLAETGFPRDKINPINCDSLELLENEKIAELGKADFVIANSLVYSVDPMIYFDLINELLRPGGRAVVSGYESVVKRSRNLRVIDEAWKKVSHDGRYYAWAGIPEYAPKGEAFISMEEFKSMRKLLEYSERSGFGTSGIHEYFEKQLREGKPIDFIGYLENRGDIELIDNFRTLLTIMECGGVVSNSAKGYFEMGGYSFGSPVMTQSVYLLELTKPKN
ncbi:Release factor glutamine methyltransferase [Candidatus Gugararchaeum adminiculabundum]|nr:Release factor glutamine methyltransferase [Candidatus Gugararchaeum adminiculabundum]